MLYIAMAMITLYASITMLEKLDKKDEIKKAQEEGYEVTFSH